MNKSILVIILLFSYLTSCNIDKSPKVPDSPIKIKNDFAFVVMDNDPSDSISTFNLSEYYKNKAFTLDTFSGDTFERQGYLLVLNRIDSLEYFSTLDNYYQDLNVPRIEMYVPDDDKFENTLISNINFIDYQDSTYIIHGLDTTIKVKKYVTTLCDIGDCLSISTLKGYVPDINSFVFWVQGYEGGGFYIFNRITGERQYIVGFPKISPNKEIILGSYYDIEIGYFSNHTELYTYKNDSIRKFLTYSEGDQFGQEGTIWKNDSLIYYIQISRRFKRKFRSLSFKKLPAPNKW